MHKKALGFFIRGSCIIWTNTSRAFGWMFQEKITLVLEILEPDLNVCQVSTQTNQKMAFPPDWSITQTDLASQTFCKGFLPDGCVKHALWIWATFHLAYVVTLAHSTLGLVVLSTKTSCLPPYCQSKALPPPPFLLIAIHLPPSVNLLPCCLLWLVSSAPPPLVLPPPQP